MIFKPSLEVGDCNQLTSADSARDKLAPKDSVADVLAAQSERAGRLADIQREQNGRSNVPLHVIFSVRVREPYIRAPRIE
jgi:hypothetical protein